MSDLFLPVPPDRTKEELQEALTKAHDRILNLFMEVTRLRGENKSLRKERDREEKSNQDMKLLFGVVLEDSPGQRIAINEEDLVSFDSRQWALQRYNDQLNKQIIFQLVPIRESSVA